MGWKRVRDYRPKSKAEYDELFEKLMEYTSFTNVDEIQSHEDLNRFFKEVIGSAPTQKKAKSLKSNKFLTEMGKSWRRLRGQDKPRKIVKLKHSRKVFTGKGAYEKAKLNDAVARTISGRNVYKSQMTIKGKSIIRFRDSKGRFVPSNEIENLDISEDE